MFAGAAESAAAGDEAPSNPFAVLGRLRRPDPQAPVVPAVPSVKNIVWKIETTPPGAEVVRSSLRSLSKGQTEAGLAIGLRESQAMRLVLLPQALRRALPNLFTQAASLLKDTSLRQALDQVKQADDARVRAEQLVSGSSAAVAGSLSVGYVVWLLRGGVLLSSLLSSLPAWQVVDPLPVLSRQRRDAEDADEDPDDPLERLFSKAQACPTMGVAIFVQNLTVRIGQ